jgi:hypothetical protein
MPILKWIVFRMVCKVSLEGRGNSDQRKATFQGGRAKAFSFQLHLLPCGLCLLSLTTVAKNLEISTCKEDEGDHTRGLLYK